MRTYSKHIASQATYNVPYTPNGIKEYLAIHLKQYQGKSFYNKALGAKILITRHSIEETTHNCMINRKAAILALYLPYILRNAKPYEIHLPVISKAQIQHFGFIEVAKMICQVKYVGIAKLTIGYRNNGEIIEYAITDFQIQNKTSLFEV